MKKCLTVKEGVEAILTLYEFAVPFEWDIIDGEKGDYTDFLVLNGVKHPLFWWREDSQVSALIQGGPSRNTCSIKINQSVKKSYSLTKLIYREFDIAEQIARSEIRNITGFGKGNSANLIVTMKNDIVVLFELTSCLNEETNDQGRRTLWGTNGMVSDRVVAHKLSGEEIYLFTEDKQQPETFTDLFIHAYGLSKSEVYKATYIARILMGDIDVSNFEATDKSLKMKVEAALKALQTEERIYVLEMQDD